MFDGILNIDGYNIFKSSLKKLYAFIHDTAIYPLALDLKYSFIIRN